jgi:type III restriction enzyme
MDSGWESVGFEFERNRIPHLLSWAKNDHLGFEIYYLWQGKVHTYFPDFLLRFEGERYMIIEVKGQKKEQDMAEGIILLCQSYPMNADVCVTVQ